MAKNNKDYDNIFKTLKASHKRFFISVINNAFNKNYPLDTIPVSLSTDSYIENSATNEIEEREADSLFSICGDTYLLECQSYEDGTMAIRIAEYAFLSAREHALWENGRAILKLPAYTIIYVKSNANTPLKTEITFQFPNGEKINYDCENVILSKFTKEEIIEKRLYPYIPYYITRYEKLISNQGDITPVLYDLEYFKTELYRIYQNKELSAEEYSDIIDYITRIIKHITDGNKVEERLVTIMGGEVEETPSHAIKRKENEKIALNLFENGIPYDLIRKSINKDMITDNRLKELIDITDDNKVEERLVTIMGGEVEETPSHAIKRKENEKIALNLFENGATYELVRNSIPKDMISDEQLNEIMKSQMKD